MVMKWYTPEEKPIPEKKRIHVIGYWCGEISTDMHKLPQRVEETVGYYDKEYDCVWIPSEYYTACVEKILYWCEATPLPPDVVCHTEGDTTVESNPSYAELKLNADNKDS